MKSRREVPYYLSFTRYKQLFAMLKIEDLINKFYLVSPFKDYVEVKHQGSAVFGYFSGDYDRDLFYDV